MPSFAAVAILLLFPGRAAAGEPAAFESTRFKARQSFLTQKQGDPTLDAAVKLAPPADPAKKQEFVGMQAAVAAAIDVQLGCEFPCASPADIQIYRGKVELIASRLGLKDGEVKAAVAHYLPEGKPRLRTAGVAGHPSASDQEIERIVLTRLLASERLAPQVREQLGRRALAMAEALGRMKTVTVDADGAAIFPGGKRRVLTPQQIAQLNAIPQAQANILRHLVANPPPPPLTPDEKQQKVLDEAERLIQEDPGNARKAQIFWKDLSQDKNRNVLTRGYAYFTRGLLAVSGLVEVEDSSARVGYVVRNDDVSAGRKAWEGTKLVGNVLMYSANFVGLGSVGQVVNGVRMFDNPIAVDGIRAVGKETAQLAAEHAGQVSEALQPALASGGRDFKAATAALNEYAAREFPGVLTVARGGKIGQADWIAEKSKILYNPLVGETHEFAHAHQMFVTRVGALEIVAKGRPLASLAPKEVDQALRLARSFEEAHYAQYEAQALRSSGFMGLAPGADYGAELAANGREITRAMLANPQWKFSKGQKFFGALSGLGKNQAQIAMSLLPICNIPIIRKKTTTTGEIIADAVSAPFRSFATAPDGKGPN